MSTKIPQQLVNSGGIVQEVHDRYATWTSFSHTLLGDDTPPLGSEGTLVCEVSITPKSAANKLLFIGTVQGQMLSGPDSYCIYVTKDTASGEAFSAQWSHSTLANALFKATLVDSALAGSTDESIYRMFFAQGGNVVYLNGTSGNRYGGGTEACTFSVFEVAA